MWKMVIIISQSPTWHLQIACFVRPTVQNQNAYMTKKISKSSTFAYLAPVNVWQFFFKKNDLINQLSKLLLLHFPSIDQSPNRFSSKTMAFFYMHRSRDGALATSASNQNRGTASKHVAYTRKHNDRMVSTWRQRWVSSHVNEPCNSLKGPCGVSV